MKKQICSIEYPEYLDKRETDDETTIDSLSHRFVLIKLTCEL